MTATLQVTDNTVAANDVLLRLDALAKGYEEVLELAKKQLESFEITETDWNRLVEKLDRRIDYFTFAGKFAARMSAALVNMQEGSDNPDSEAIVRLLDALTHRIEGRLRQLIESEVRAAVVDQTVGLRAEIMEHGRAAAQGLIDRTHHDALIDTERQRSALRSLLQHSLGGEFKRLALEAAREVNAND